MEGRLIAQQCPICKLVYVPSKSTSALRLTYCSFLCELGDLGFSMSGLEHMERAPPAAPEDAKLVQDRAATAHPALCVARPGVLRVGAARGANHDAAGADPPLAEVATDSQVDGLRAAVTEGKRHLARCAGGIPVVGERAVHQQIDMLGVLVRGGERS